MNRVVACFCWIFLWGCTEPNVEQKPETTSSPVTILEVPTSKEVHPKVEVEGASGLSYALYLPGESKGQPLLLWLDPHGEGELPVQKYRSLADAYGFALAGSNDSQNGMQPTEVLQMVNATLDDLQKRLSPEPRQIYLGGFSGGARAAVMVAQNRNDISAVIGCGAGYAPRPGQTWAFYGLAGREDLNYQEFVQLESVLATVKAPHWVEFFSGGHAWPPIEKMDGALAFLLSRAMNNGVVPLDSMRLGSWDEWKKNLQIEVEDALQARKTLRAIAHLKGLSETQTGEEAIGKWESSRGYSAYHEARSRLASQEQALKEQCQYELQTENLEFWQGKAFSLRMEKKDRDQMDMQLRVLNHLSLVSYSLTGQYLQQNDLENAEISAQKYALVDPTNPEPHVMLAQVRARRGQGPEAIRALGEAAFRDFDDPVRLRTEPDFLSFHQLSGWTETLEQVQKNQQLSREELENPQLEKPFH